MTTPAIWRKVFKILPSDHLGINYDPSHFVWQMVDYIRPLYEFAVESSMCTGYQIVSRKATGRRVMAYPLDFMSLSCRAWAMWTKGRYVSALTGRKL